MDLLEQIGTFGGFNYTIVYDSFDRERFVRGIGFTLALSLACILLSTVGGLVLALLHYVRGRPTKALIELFVSIFRNTPPLVQIYFFFFGLGALFGEVFGGGFVVSATTWAVISLSAFIGALNTESFRAGIEALPKGYIEGAKALGLRRWVIIWKIVVPLAVRAALPSLTNNLVELIKATSYAYAIAVPEILYVSSQIWADELNVIEMMSVLFLSYFVLIGGLISVMRALEHRMAVPGFGTT
jgi:polar amino acid transport system permease protein